MPIAFRGGFLQELWKGKGDPAQCGSYRDIFVEDHVGKIFASEMRERVRPYYGQYALETQCGGIQGRGADFAMHMASSIWQAAHSANHSAGVVFLDLTAAFASMARELLDMQDYSDEAVTSFMARHGLGPDHWQEVLQALAGGGAMADAGVPSHLRAILKELCSNTWFTIQGLLDPSCSRKGTRAGNPLGDLLFTCAVTKILLTIREKLQSAGLLEVIPRPQEDTIIAQADGGPPVPTVEVSYVDDTLYYSIQESAKAVVHRLAAMAGIFLWQLYLHGMKVNFGTGKTEAVLALRGAQARQLMRTLCDQGGIPVAGPPGTPPFVKIVTSYKHMGAVSNIRPHKAQEARSRAAAAHTTIKAISARVLAA